MTREQAKREIDSLDFYLQNHTDDYDETSHTAMMMAIKSLEQEPCEDAISRQEVIKLVEDWWIGNTKNLVADIKSLPPVTLQESFMNKPCIANQVCREDKVKMLDKIRAEIVELPTISINANDVYKAQVLQIINKYKSEKEKKNDT